jgi:hypothetical protein
VIEIHAQYYGTRQAVGESTDSFLSRKRRITKRIFPNITEEKFMATCCFLVLDPSHLQEPPQPSHPTDVVPHVPFAGGPNQGHHKRPNIHQIPSQNEPKDQLIAKLQVELTLTKKMLPMI